MPHWIKQTKHLLGILGVMTVAACSGAEGCEGVQPLPTGFDPAARIENAASIRITQAGLDFVEKNLATLAGKFLETDANPEAGVLTFPIDRIDLKPGLGTEITVCIEGSDPANDSCVAEIDIAHTQLSLSTANPNVIVGQGTVPLRLKVLPIEGKVLFVPGLGVKGALSGGGNNDCNPDTMTFAKIPFQVEIAVEVEHDPTHASRVGYSKVNVKTVAIDETILTDSLHFCGGGLDDAALNTLKPLIGGMLLGGFTNNIVDTINATFCVAPNPANTPPCPAGSTAKDDKCVYPDGACVSTMLGLDGNIDIGKFLSTFSPGTKGSLDFLLALGGPGKRDDDASSAWGDLNPVLEGATFGLFGGVLPTAVSNCVNPVTLSLPTGIPQPNELRGNALNGWTGEGPHVGVALSERFLNYAMGAAYNSGALCLGFSTEEVDMLSTGLFALLVPSIPTLSHQKQRAPLALVLRPQKPPSIELGNGSNIEEDPLVRLLLNEAAIDFYVWSSDRFIRAFTAQFDLDVPLNLLVSAEGITPVLDKIYVNNPQVTNAELLKDDPATIATSLATMVEGLAADFLGEISAFDVSGLLSAFDIELELQQTGIRRLKKGNDNFLGVFAGLRLGQSITSLPSRTTIELIRKETSPEAFRLSTFKEENRPRIILRAYSSLDYGSNSIEYTYKLNNGLWHSWQTSNDIIVDDAFLLMQGMHTIAVKSRLTGQHETEDPSPALIDIRIDVQAPVLSLDNDRDSLRIDGWDLVSDRSALEVRHSFDGASFGEWASLKELQALEIPSGASSISVEVRDEEGNVASTQQSLIRGRANKSGTGLEEGCQCTLPKGSTHHRSAFLLIVAGLWGLGWTRRRISIRRSGLRNALGSLAVLAVAGSWAGCHCGDKDETSNPTPSDRCGTDGNDPCIELEPGLIGSYTSAALAPDGTLWVAGYNEADWEENVRYGDLVVGKWNGSAVDWVSIDGVPDQEVDDTVFDPTSWRGGNDSPGPDVGLWTSLQVDGAGMPRVAYWDVTNKALKFASYDGSTWTSSFVYQKPGVEAGRYAKLLLIGNIPTLVFQVIEPGDAGFATSKVILGRATSTTPSSPGEWVFEDVAVDHQTPCRSHLCTGSQKCFADTGQCALRTDDCDPKCASGTGCLDGTCLSLFDETKLDAYPDAIGGYITFAHGSDGQLGIVYYDRIRGNLMGAHRGHEEWVTTVLDGQQGDPPEGNADVGIGASLTIDNAGDWHIAYVDGINETLKYMHVSQGVVVEVELVDDGTGTDDGRFGDGRHIVGDDANITLSLAGDVRIAYQDATAGTLRWAVGEPAAKGHDWSRRVLVQDGFGGFFPQQIVQGSSTQIVNWWRKGGIKIHGDVRVLSP